MGRLARDADGVRLRVQRLLEAVESPLSKEEVLDGMRAEFLATEHPPLFFVNPDLEPAAVEPGDEGAAPDPFPASRFVIEQSWWIASELCRRHDFLRTYEMHPAGGMYDVLRVFDQRADVVSEAPAVDMNREGSIHALDVEGIEPISWQRVLAADTPHDVVKQLERVRGWELAGQALPTTPTSLTYRVISRILTRGLNDRERWDARSVFLDTAGNGAGVREEYATKFPKIPELARELRESTPTGQEPESRLWMLLSDATPTVLFDDRGFAHTGSGDRIELMPTYLAAKHSIDGVVDRVS